ncbi:MAG: LeuD/DmdB family oxidoreductase small subunit, partial [Candidatus Heimdallarchaeaceae archaeon]
EYETIGEHAMEGVDVDFSKKIKNGDILVAGNNFGSGSSRETAQIALKYSGVSLVVARSFARIFFRNCINVGLSVMVFDKVEEIEQNDELEMNLITGKIRNISKNKVYQASKLPEHILNIVKVGGLKEYLKLKYLKKYRRSVI